MKTAVEWFAQKLSEQGIDYPLQEFKQAKEMEKEQIIEFHVGCCEDGYNIETSISEKMTDEIRLELKAHAEQYYTETFKSE